MRKKAAILAAFFVLAARANVPDFIVKGGVTYRIISDHLGSPRFVIDTTIGASLGNVDMVIQCQGNTIQ